MYVEYIKNLLKWKEKIIKKYTMENNPERWKTFGKLFGLAGIFGAIFLESFLSMEDLITSQTEGYDQNIVCSVRNGMSFITGEFLWLSSFGQMFSHVIEK